MRVDANVVKAVAARLRQASETGVAIPPIREELGNGGVAAAYAVQQANTDHYLKQGRRLVGRKIGLTSKSVQKQLGVDSPDFGMLFADMALYDGEEVTLGKVLQPKVEAEIAFVLERDLTQAGVTLADLISAVAYALPAVEIVGSRIANWNIKLLDTIADNASSGLFVLGTQPRKLDALDLRLCGMAMERRGEPVSFGAGVACLGNPLNAALWLARTMVEVGNPLKSGDIIMSGALGPMVGVAPGDVLETRINGLGTVRAAFAQV
jgi:2-keto-4-pentenoate hydratase